MFTSLSVEVRRHGDAEVEALEYDVYSRAGYIPPNPYRKVLENSDYPEHDVVVAHCRNQLVGSVRLVVDPMPPRGLFSLHCFEPFALWPWAEQLLKSTAPEQRLQVGTMVIREEFRGGPVFQAMFAKVLELSMLKGIRFAAATIDETFFYRLNQRNVPFIPMGETLQYMGTRTVPALVARDWITRGFVPSDIMPMSREPALASPIAAAASA